MGRPRTAIAKAGYTGDRRDTLRNPRDMKELERERAKKIAERRKKKK